MTKDEKLDRDEGVRGSGRNGPTTRFRARAPEHRGHGQQVLEMIAKHAPDHVPPRPRRDRDYYAQFTPQAARA